MQKIIIKHLKGSKVNQTEMFELPFTELILGRDNSANIKFDPEKDDLVGRSHAKITHEGDHFKLTDLNSRNGTFVNGKRIQEPVILNVGDLVKLGEAGVEFSFDMAPRPENTAKATRFEQSTASVTREQPKATRVTTQESPTTKSSIGRATVERLITETTSQTRKKMINIASGIIAVIVLGAGFLLYQSNRGQEVLATALGQQKAESERTIGELEKKLPTGLSATEIATKYSASTVYIESSWKLIDMDSGQQLFQKVVCPIDKKKKKCTDEVLPLYVSYQGIVEPWLVTEAVGMNDKPNIPIGSFGNGQSGSGFVVTKDGFIMSNRHVVASWDTDYVGNLKPGYLMEIDCKPSCSDNLKKVEKPIQWMGVWVPSKAKMRGGSPAKGKYTDGRNDFLDVTFPNTRIRIPAHLVRTSDIADVALIKIEIPGQVSSVILGSDDFVKGGELVTITGFPANSPDVEIKIKSQDPMNRSNDWRVLPIPTVSSGTIGKIINGNDIMQGDATSDYRSKMGDVYQLNVNTINEGNSGGPIFNDAGRVIGLYTYGSIDKTNSFGVPIKYGEELMGVKPIN